VPGEHSHLSLAFGCIQSAPTSERYKRTLKMNCTLFPSIASRFAALFAAGDAPEQDDPPEVTDPADSPNMLGTTCRAHGCPRYLDEVPLIARDLMDSSVRSAKLELFPNSWSAVACSSIAASKDRHGRARMVVVRYCPECRDAAQACRGGLQAVAA
jgi:hypothetical protein